MVAFCFSLLPRNSEHENRAHSLSKSPQPFDRNFPNKDLSKHNAQFTSRKSWTAFGGFSLKKKNQTFLFYLPIYKRLVVWIPPLRRTKISSRNHLNKKKAWRVLLIKRTSQQRPATNGIVLIYLQKVLFGQSEATSYLEQVYRDSIFRHATEGPLSLRLHNITKILNWARSIIFIIGRKYNLSHIQGFLTKHPQYLKKP